MDTRTARSKDGTSIAYTVTGEGPVLVLVDAAGHFRDSAPSMVCLPSSRTASGSSSTTVVDEEPAPTSLAPTERPTLSSNARSTTWPQWRQPTADQRTCTGSPRERYSHCMLLFAASR